jgi:putative transposase
MVEPDRADLSIVRQCRLLSISRSTFYAQPSGESAVNLAIMAEIDRQFLDTPF